MRVVAGVVPWYRNQLFGATVGATILAWVNGRWHLGLPSDGTSGLAIGLALMWGLHAVLIDLEGMRASNAPVDQVAATWAKWLEDTLPTVLPIILDRLPPPVAYVRPPKRGQLSVIPGAEPPDPDPPNPEPPRIQ